MPRLRLAAPLLLALALTAHSLAAQAAPPGFREEWLRQFNNSSYKLVELAQAIPDDKFNWAPGEGVMPVGQVYGHIARYNYYYPATGLGVAAPAGTDLEGMEQIRDKAQLVELLRASARHVRETVQRMPEAELAAATRLYDRDTTRWSVLLQLLAHMNEHLGQSIAYARMNGVVPPWSRGNQ